MCQRWVRQETRHCDLPQSRAFSSEVDTGSREENASKQKDRAPFRFHRNGKGSEDSNLRNFSAIAPVEERWHPEVYVAQVNTGLNPVSPVLSDSNRLPRRMMRS